MLQALQLQLERNAVYMQTRKSHNSALPANAEALLASQDPEMLHLCIASHFYEAAKNFCGPSNLTLPSAGGRSTNRTFLWHLASTQCRQQSPLCSHVELCHCSWAFWWALCRCWSLSLAAQSWVVHTPLIFLSSDGSDILLRLPPASWL